MPSESEMLHAIWMRTESANHATLRGSLVRKKIALKEIAGDSARTAE